MVDLRHGQNEAGVGEGDDKAVDARERREWTVPFNPGGAHPPVEAVQTAVGRRARHLPGAAAILPKNFPAFSVEEQVNFGGRSIGWTHVAFNSNGRRIRARCSRHGGGPRFAG